MAEYIKLYRSIIDTPMYKDAFFFKFWILCMFETLEQPTNVHTPWQRITLQPGQFEVDSRSWLLKYNGGAAPRHCLTWRQMWRYLKRLESYGYITINSHPHGRRTYHVVTVVNWARYYKVDP